MKKNIPWRFGFTGEVSYAKTELWSFGSFPRIRELTYSLTGVVQMYPLNGFQL